MENLLRNLLLIALATTIALGLARKFYHGQGFDGYNMLGGLLFALFTGIALHLAGVSPTSGFHLDIRISEINFIPLYGMRAMMAGGWDKHALTNILGNILMCAPIGFFLPLLFVRQRQWYKTVLSGFLFSLLIECSQLFLLRGTDVDDLILNTFGALLGYLTYVLFANQFPKFSSRFTMRAHGFAYVAPLMLIMIPYIVLILIGCYEIMIYQRMG